MRRAIFHPSFFILIDPLRAIPFQARKAYCESVKRRQVLLIQMQSLLSDGLRHIFMGLDDIDLVCLACPEVEKIDAWVIHLHPDMVILAGEKEDELTRRLILNLLNQYSEIPIAWVELETNVLHVYTSQALTATSAELINAIRKIDSSRMEIVPFDEQSGSG